MSTDALSPESHEHHHKAGAAREVFRSVTRDVAWVAEAPKPPKAWYAALEAYQAMDTERPAGTPPGGDLPIGPWLDEGAASAVKAARRRMPLPSLRSRALTPYSRSPVA